MMEQPRVVGYWSPPDEYPDAKKCVNEQWAEEHPDEFLMLCEHLENGEHHAAYKGQSRCRICGEANGSTELTDGKFYWPQGLLHYVLEHHVIPPNPGFLLYVLKQRKVLPRINQIGTKTGRFSSARPNLAQPPRPDSCTFMLEMRPPTFKEEAAMLVHMTINEGRLPPGFFQTEGGIFVVENLVELNQAVASMWRPPVEPISAILEANSLKDIPREYKIEIEKRVGCKPIETDRVMSGWGCCQCRTYNGIDHADCKNCGHERCDEPARH